MPLRLLVSLAFRVTWLMNGVTPGAFPTRTTTIKLTKKVFMRLPKTALSGVERWIDVAGRLYNVCTELASGPQNGRRSEPGRIPAIPPLRCLVKSRVLPSPLRDEPELQGQFESAENGFPDEGKPRQPRAGNAQAMGGGRALWANPGCARGSGVIRSPRRAPVCEWGRAYGHGAEQNPQGFGREIENDGRFSRAVSAGLGLPRIPHRIQ